MKRISIINSHDAQREYVRACEIGYGFAVHGNFAHYLFRREHVEPSILRDLDKRLGTFDAYIWTFKGCTMQSASSDQDWWIVPCADVVNWLDRCRFIAAKWEDRS